MENQLLHRAHLSVSMPTRITLLLDGLVMASCCFPTKYKGLAVLTGAV
jgi:hypothetical protein